MGWGGGTHLASAAWQDSLRKEEAETWRLEDRGEREWREGMGNGNVMNR